MSARKASRTRADHSAIGLSGPISHTILDHANRIRYRATDDLVERHAREMQAAQPRLLDLPQRP